MMTTDKQLFMMVGLPRSGKTRTAQYLSKEYNAPIVCPDEVRRAIHGEEYIQSAERFIWATVHAMVKALFLAGHNVVILDACNHRRDRRADFKDEMWERVFYVVDVATDICVQRAEGNERLQKDIRRKAEKFEPIDYKEGEDLYVEWQDDEGPELRKSGV